MSIESKTDPESLVARIIEELQENPEAQPLLLRALLTNEFLGMPARLIAIEKDIAELKSDNVELKSDVAVLKGDVAQLKADVSELKTDVSELKTDVSELKTDVAQLKTDVAELKGRSLQNSLHDLAFGQLTTTLRLRRTMIMRGPGIQGIPRDFDDAVQGDGLTGAQRERVLLTDLVVRALNIDTANTVYVAVEASYTVDEHDVDRARASAQALATAFPDAESVPAVWGVEIPDHVRRAANEAGVRLFQESPAH